MGLVVFSGRSDERGREGRTLVACLVDSGERKIAVLCL